MRAKWGRVVAMMIILVWAGSPAWAMRGGTRHMNQDVWGERGGLMLGRVWDQREFLGLTAEQETKMRQVYFDTQKQVIRDRAAVDQAKLEITRLMDGYALEEKSLRKAVDAWFDAKRQAMQTRVSHLVAVRKMLSEEQYAKLQSLYSQGQMGIMRREDCGPGMVCPMPRGKGDMAPGDEPLKPRYRGKQHK